ncbi:MAG: peptidylprolyl isomerase [Bacillota bacterium]
MKKWIIAGVVVIIAGCALAVYMRSGVATVNGERITPSEFYSALQNDSGKQTLERLMLERLIKQEARKQSISVSDAEIQKGIDEIKSQFATEAEFDAALEDSGMSLGDLRDSVRLNELVRKLSLKGVTITEEDIQKYFEENKDSLGQPARVRARHILVGTKDEADEVLKRVRAGEDFATLASALSTDTGTKINGGDLGFIKAGETEEAFEKAAFALKPGEVSDVVETSYGFHVIKVEAREEAKPATLEDSREKIVEALENERAKPVDEVISEIRAASDIKVFWDRCRALEHAPEAESGQD